jgi:hypothetical protein
LAGSGPSEAAVFWPRLLSVSFTALIVPIMAQLMQTARRRAFDAAFDLALSAQRGASLSTMDAVTGRL